VLAEVELTLEEAAQGAEREIEIEVLSECPDCEGAGTAPGTFPQSCFDCGGTGELRQVRRTMFGNMMTATPCARCAGTGQMITDPCPRCNGAGRIPLTESLTVQVPAGVDDGARLRVTGRGEAGPRGGRSGDLYVSIGVLPHDVFQRAGDDLACEVPVPMTVAALGGLTKVPTLDGHEEITVSPGTQSGEVVRFRGKGMPRLNGRGRGELVGVLRVETPRDLSGEETELLVQFAKLRGDEDAEPRGLFGRIKEAFN
jgi:molecular chaperone DnaJ